ncbi:MAG TPA: transcriptional repressor [Chloroflexi bacterium]|nr:transcriptional repressor [Chloroflexota bacterium]HPO58327.1 Fur family transcriptional regulator [Anaerolineaceae bacterium]
MSHNTRNYAKMMRDRGFRVTHQRRLVLDAVCEGGAHTTVDEIYARLQQKDPSISLSTLYRTLDFLTRLHLVVEARTPDGKTSYEIASLQPHHHLVCRTCGREEQIGPEEVQHLYAEIERVYGFLPDEDHLVLSGLCRSCRARQAA